MPNWEYGSRSFWVSQRLHFASCSPFDALITLLQSVKVWLILLKKKSAAGNGPRPRSSRLDTRRHFGFRIFSVKYLVAASSPIIMAAAIRERVRISPKSSCARYSSMNAVTIAATAANQREIAVRIDTGGHQPRGHQPAFQGPHRFHQSQYIENGDLRFAKLFGSADFQVWIFDLRPRRWRPVPS